MATKVEVHGVHRLAAAVVVDAKNGRLILTPALKNYRIQLEKTATRHYRNLGTIVKFQLSGGIGDPSSSGSRIIATTDGEGKPISYATGPWPALNADYARRKPLSRRMWKKTGGLHSSLRRDIPRNKLKVKIAKKLSQKLKTRKNRIQAVHLLQFSDPGNEVLARLITEPFIHGRGSIAEGFIPTGNIDVNSSELIYLPEATIRKSKGSPKGIKRPWVAGLSGRLGSGMHKAIRKLKINT